MLAGLESSLLRGSFGMESAAPPDYTIYTNPARRLSDGDDA
jgi:hypothetical protein